MSQGKAEKKNTAGSAHHLKSTLHTLSLIIEWVRDENVNENLRQSWHYEAFVNEQDVVEDGVAEHKTIPGFQNADDLWVTVAQLLPRHNLEHY